MHLGYKALLLRCMRLVEVVESRKSIFFSFSWHVNYRERYRFTATGHWCRRVVEDWEMIKIVKRTGKVDKHLRYEMKQSV